MKTLGLIGGMTWLSTVDYYRLINETINRRLGGNHSGRLILHSVDFAELVPTVNQLDWRHVASQLCAIARTLESAGAQGLVMCANTPHKVAGEIRDAVTIPLIDITEATTREVQAKRLQTVALLGTRFTMEEDFYKKTLSAAGIETVVPDPDTRAFIHGTIFDELGKGILAPETKRRYLGIIDTLGKRGAEGVILGCTEIPLIVKPGDVPLPVFDTTEIHVAAAVAFALDE